MVEEIKRNIEYVIDGLQETLAIHDPENLRNNNYLSFDPVLNVLDRFAKILRDAYEVIGASEFDRYNGIVNGILGEYA